jgi:hypothetical protein
MICVTKVRLVWASAARRLGGCVEQRAGDDEYVWVDLSNGPRSRRCVSIAGTLGRGWQHLDYVSNGEWCVLIE